MRVAKLMGLAGLMLFVLLLEGCASHREISASRPYINNQYMRRLEKVFVIINMPTFRNPERVAEYLKEELDYLFLREDVIAEIVIDDETVSGEALGTRIDMFAPQHLMTIVTNETQALEVRLYDQQEDILVYNVVIRTPLMRNVVDLAQQIATAIGTQLHESSLL